MKRTTMPIEKRIHKLRPNASKSKSHASRPEKKKERKKVLASLVFGYILLTLLDSIDPVVVADLSNIEGLHGPPSVTPPGHGGTEVPKIIA